MIGLIAVLLGELGFSFSEYACLLLTEEIYLSEVKQFRTKSYNDMSAGLAKSYDVEREPVASAL